MLDEESAKHVKQIDPNLGEHYLQDIYGRISYFYVDVGGKRM